MVKKSRTAKASTGARKGPVAMTGLEIAIATEILKEVTKDITGAGMTGAGSLAAYLSKEGPIAHRVLASWSEDGHFCIAIEFVNATLHGAYVERIDTEKPKKDLAISVASKRKPKANLGLGADPPPGGDIPWQRPETLIPVYVPPAAPVRILLRLTDDDAKSLSKSATMTFSFEISLVGGKSHKKTKQFDVLLRKSGPNYTPPV